MSPEELLAQAARETEPKMAAWHCLAEHATGHPVRKVVLTGKAADEILQFLQVGAHDLLVMGTHGRIGLAHFVIGSVTEEVERHAPCPVLVVRNS